MTQKRSAGCALARRRNMSQATALGARMCQGTFFFMFGTWIGMEETMRKHGKIRTLHRAVPIFLAALSLISGSILADLCTERLEEQKQEQEIQKQEQLAELVKESSKISPIDFAYLISCNPDTAAWLYIPETNIDYPVVQGKDNETYMTRNFYGEEAPSGTIFLDYQSALRQKNYVFYGHNMKNGTMFRDIARYAEKTYFDTHRQIWLYTPQETLELEAVEWFSAPNSRELREQCLTEQTKGTYVFVTCSYDGKDNRGILWAREVSRVELPNKKSYGMMLFGIDENKSSIVDRKQGKSNLQAGG